MDSLMISILGMLVSVVLALFGMVFKRINSMDTRLRDAPSRDEVRDLMSDKMEPVNVLQQELKEDVRSINNKLDRLLERRED